MPFSAIFLLILAVNRHIFLIFGFLIKINIINIKREKKIDSYNREDWISCHTLIDLYSEYESDTFYWKEAKINKDQKKEGLPYCLGLYSLIRCGLEMKGRSGNKTIICWSVKNIPNSGKGSKTPTWETQGIKDKRSLQKGRFIIYFKRPLIGIRNSFVVCTEWMQWATHLMPPHEPITCLNAWTLWAQFDNTFGGGVHFYLYFTFPNIPFCHPHTFCCKIRIFNSFCTRSFFSK